MADDDFIGRPIERGPQWSLSPHVRVTAKPPTVLYEAGCIIQCDERCARWRSGLARMAKDDVDVVVAWYPSTASLFAAVQRIAVKDLSDDATGKTVGYTAVRRRKHTVRQDGQDYEETYIVRNRKRRPGQYGVMVLLEKNFGPRLDRLNLAGRIAALNVMGTMAHELLHAISLHEHYPDNYTSDYAAGGPEDREYDALRGELTDVEHGGLRTYIDPATLRLVQRPLSNEPKDKLNPEFAHDCQLFHEAAIEALGLKSLYKP